MSEETIRAAVSAFNRRDERGWLECLDVSVEFLDQLTLNPNVYSGHDGAAKWFRSWEKAWEDFTISGVEVAREHGNVSVFRFTARGRGRGSGVEVAQDFWGVGIFKDMRATRMEFHTTERAALEAAGLSEQD